MLTLSRRLRRSADFQAAVRGRRAARPLLVVHLALDGTAVPARAGLIVNKAVGGAVTRNTVKRRLRHLLRDRLDQLPAGSRLVVRALPGAGGATSTELARDLDGALSSLLGRVVSREPSA